MNEFEIKIKNKTYRITKEVGGKHWEVCGLGPKKTIRTYRNKKTAINAVMKNST
ncbi:MAG: hypothetical protein ACOCUT_00130 [bacterium]